MAILTHSYKTAEELPIWKISHHLTLQVYKITQSFPDKEIYGLTSQLRRSASSIPANICEGFYRRSTKELLQFLYNARGSYGETLYHLLLARDLGYIKVSDYDEIIKEYEVLGKQLNGWINSLKKKV